MSDRDHNGKNFANGIKTSTARIMGGKKRKLGSSSGEKDMIMTEVKENAREWFRHEKEDKSLRQSVLNKLWDSLPPETQILSSLDDEDSDSTQSGLDEGEVPGEENVEISPKFETPKDRQSPEFRKEQNSQSELFTQGYEDSIISWNTNLDFIQSIIWLKSTTAKLQRVPAGEFLKKFKNQWETSPQIKSPDNLSQIRNFVSNSVMQTEQRKKINLIRNRLNTRDYFGENRSDIEIPETDESENPSLQSSQCAADRPAFINVSEVSEPIGYFNNTDSGFGSEKPESIEKTNSSQYLTENANKRRKIGNVESTRNVEQKENLGPLDSGLVAKDRVKFLRGQSRGSIHGEGCSSSENPFREISPNIRTDERRTTKRKHDAVFGSAPKSTTPKQPRLSISSATLNYVLRSSDCNKVLLNSVRVILKFLENEEEEYHSLGNNWNNSVRKEAIDAIVSVVDLLEKEKGSNSCKNEVIATVKRVLMEMLLGSEIEKPTVWEHRRLVMLELCNSFAVCTEVVNYLISELKKLIPVSMQTTGENIKESTVVMDKSYILFHSLKIALRKYRSFAPPRVTTGEVNVSQKIPEVTDLWKRQWRVNQNDSDIFVTGLERLEIPEDPEEVWTDVLEKLVVVSTTIWPLVKILAWQCLAVLKSRLRSAARDRRTLGILID